MLEIIALFFLTRQNGRLAIKKGLNPTPWRWYTVLAWIVAEVVGIMVGFALFGEQLLGVILFALACAFGGYLLVRNTLEKKPDSIEDDIDRIGTDDLRP